MAVVQESIKNAFDIVIGFDDLIQGDKPLRILPKTKIAKDPNPMIYAERWKDSSQLYMDVGDGMKAYLKILLSILDPSKSIILIDEPEAFLHPPQRRNLGALIARLARDNAKQIFVATHDSEFMRGVISSTNDVKVLNLRNDLKSRQVVDVQLEDFVTLTNDTPSLLNERILNSFFYDKSVLTENESDRVFYEYAAAHYHYLDQQDVNFIGLFGIDSTIDVMKKMREIGINAVSIVDIDFLLDRQYPTFLKSEDTKNAHHNFKQYFNNQCYDRKQLKKSGLKYLKDIDHRAYHLLEEVIDKYAQVGIYIVPVGELESWAQTSKNNLTDLIQYITEKRRTKLYRFLKNVLRVS
jgi:predicted ATP-dependent endonuclease of OLD family